MLSELRFWDCLVGMAMSDYELLSLAVHVSRSHGRGDLYRSVIFIFIVRLRFLPISYQVAWPAHWSNNMKMG